MRELSEKDRKIVGSPLNFRGLVYGPINEQGVVYLFGLIAEDLNIRVESIQQGYPDCTQYDTLARVDGKESTLSLSSKAVILTMTLTSAMY